VALELIASPRPELDAHGRSLIESPAEVAAAASAAAHDAVHQQQQEEATQAEALSTCDPGSDPSLRKYWAQRYRLFSRFDAGVMLDRESWFSVTPERIAQHQAQRCQCNVILDAFCGAGGNAIQFARTCARVIAVDLDPAKLALARHNARIYGVADRIEFVCADFFQVAPTLRADVVFLSPPWGGPDDDGAGAIYDLSRVQRALGGAPDATVAELMRAARRVTRGKPAVALYLPRNANLAQVVSLSLPGEKLEVEQNMLNWRLKTISVYFNDLVDTCTENY